MRFRVRPASVFLSAAALTALTIGLLFPAISAPRQDKDAPKHAIDKALDVCMKKDVSTAGMIECLASARKSWDKEMNTQYQTLMGRLDTKGKAALKTAQLQWLKFRDSEYAALNGIYSKTQGTMYLPMEADDAMQITRTRAKQLAEYNAVLKIDAP
jgi:uncharacterized protein YecT (DUF1311 family)